MKGVAKVISVVFHPLFLFMYTVVLLILMNPYMFGYGNISEAVDLLLLVFVTVIPIPLLSVAMLKGLGWIETFSMRNKSERIAPYLITGLIYLSLFMQLSRTDSAQAFQIATLGAVVTIFGAFFFNNFYKISLHAAGAGAMTSTLILCVLVFATDTFSLEIGSYYGGEYPTRIIVYSSLICCGLICTAAAGAGSTKHLLRCKC